MKTQDFEEIIDSIKKCYSKDYLDRLPSLADFEDEKLNASSNEFYNSVALRLEAITDWRRARDLNLMLDYRSIWSKISESIKILPPEATISSIGSQGFLSIPLFKYELDKSNFEFLRLHIWDSSLDKYVNAETRNNFSIHNHSFHADSWILCGEIINDRYLVEKTSTESDMAFFSIEYNKTLNEVNQHTSIARRTTDYAIVKQLSHEIYMQEGYYSINAGRFHRSGTNDTGVSATLFSFTSDCKFKDGSSVLGPGNIEFSEINRKMFINPIDLIKKIDQKVHQ